MSTQRLTFLYPHLFRSIRLSEPAIQPLRRRPRTAQPQCLNSRPFTTSKPQRQKFVQRHGKAVEPFIPAGDSADGVKVYVPEEETNQRKDGSKEATKPEAQTPTTAKLESNPSSAAPLSDETTAAMNLPDYDAEKGTAKVPEKKEEKPSPLQKAALNTKDTVAPLETILEMPPPESAEEQNALKPPHLQTPPYVHHFDTYTLVKRVEEGGFTTEQSITTMKAVRGLLAQNLEVAKAGLVSKSDVENETYLFRAACSELKTEVQNIRNVNDETMRRERTLLQHEVDNLNQKLTQELLTLKDELKGMFDDRKMTVRTEQRAMESGIQELNYKITVGLNSDSKSEIEGLRWVLTKRSVMGILFMAFMVLTSLRYASYKSHEDEVRKKKEELKPDEVGFGGGNGGGGEIPAQGAAEILAAN